MNSSSKNDNLRNKFDNVESLFDSNSRMQSSDDFVTKNEFNKKSILYSCAKTIFLLVRIVCIKVKYIFAEILPSVSIFIFRLLKTGVTSFLTQLQRTNDDCEVVLDNYLGKIELRNDLKKINDAKTSLDFQKNCNEFELSLKKNFWQSGCNVNFEPEVSDFGKISKTFSYDEKIYQDISKLLEESKLISNVDYLNIKIKLGKKEITHILEFDLKVAGSSWAHVFSKFIGKKLQQNLETLNGSTSGEHLQNLTALSDVYRFIFIHQRLEIMEVFDDLSQSLNSLKEDDELHMSTPTSKSLNQDI